MKKVILIFFILKISLFVPPLTFAQISSNVTTVGKDDSKSTSSPISAISNDKTSFLHLSKSTDFNRQETISTNDKIDGKVRTKKEEKN